MIAKTFNALLQFGLTQGKLSIKGFLFYGLVIFPIFSPVILFGQILFGNTDNIFVHYPNLILGARSLREGSLPLYNDAIWCGSAFYKDIHNHMLNPFYWIISLIPNYELISYSLYVFVLFVIIAMSSDGIASLYGLSAGRSFVFAMIVGISGFTWFTTTTFSTLMLASSTATIYVLLHLFKAEKKLHSVNYILLLVFFLMACLYCAHPAYIAAYMTPVMICSLAILFATKEKTKTFFILGAAGILCLLFAWPRWNVTLINIAEGSMKIGGWPPSMITGKPEQFHMLLTALSPHAFGYNMGEHLTYFGKVNNTGCNLQFHSAPFIGLIGLVFLAKSLLLKYGKKGFFLTMLSIFLLVAAIVPGSFCSLLVQIVLYPSHGIIYKVLSFFFCSWAILHIMGSIMVEEIDCNFVDIGIIIIVTFISALATYDLLSFDIKEFPFNIIRIIIFALLVTSSLFIILLKKDRRMALYLNVGRKIGNKQVIMISNTIVCISMILFLFRIKVLTEISRYLLLQEALFICVITNSLRLTYTKENVYPKVGFLVAIFFMFFSTIKVPWVLTRPLSEVLIFQSIGVAHLLILVFSFFFVASSKNDNTNTVRSVLLIVILYFDLLSCSKTFAFHGSDSFASERKIYPELRSKSGDIFKKLSKLDLLSFRVNNPWNIVPQYGFNNIFSIYGIRTIGGSSSFPEQGWLDYLTSQGLEKTAVARHGILPTIPLNCTNVIFATGTAYTFLENQEVLENPAFPRLCALKEGRIQQYEKILPSTANNSKIEIEFTNLDKKLVRFGDKYDQNWRLYLDNEPGIIRKSPDDFMLIDVPKGTKSMRLFYRPIDFIKEYALSLITFGLLSLILAFCTLANLVKKCAPRTTTKAEEKLFI